MYHVIIPPSTQEDEGRFLLHSSYATANAAGEARTALVAQSKGWYGSRSILIAQDLPL